MTDELEYRKKLTFAQAEGVEPMPSQLALKELSKPLRARLLRVLLESLEADMGSDVMGQTAPWVQGAWAKMLYDKHTIFDDGFADEYSNKFKPHYVGLSQLIKTGNYVAVFGTIQFFLRHPAVPFNLHLGIEAALRGARAAYRVLDKKTIVPIATAEEGQAIERAFTDLASSEFNGARRHLREAGEHLTMGRWSDSVRESIHAVEAVSRLLDPGAKTLEPALSALAKSGYIHPAMKHGFAKLYGYTSDEQGIRHAHINEAVQVDETDALYMFGACAAFVTYLIGKARSWNLLRR